MTTLLQVTTSATGGGIQTLARQLADEASNRDWRSVVAYYRDGAPKSKAEYLRLPPGGVVRRWPFALASLVRRLRPDFVLLHGATPGSIGAAAVRAAGLKRIIYKEASPHATRPRVLRALRRVTARIPVMNVAVSEAVARSLARDAHVPSKRIRVIPNGVPPADAVPEPQAPPRLLCVANLWPWKGHRTLLRALSLLPEEVTLDLVGNGPERPRVEAEARRLGLAQRVSFRGWLDDPWSVAAGAWAQVHPSFVEGMPLAVAEGMMRGLPIVGSAVGGVPEIVEDGVSGLLVRPGDARALAEAIGRLIADSALRDSLGEAARAFALEHLRLEDCVEGYFRLFEELGA